MGCIIGAIFIFLFGIGLAVILFPFVYMGLSRAKKEARLIISSDRIIDLKKTDRVMKVLAGFITDIEAKDLWHKLQALKDKENIV